MIMFVALPTKPKILHDNNNKTILFVALPEKPKIFFTPSHDTEFHQASWYIDNKQISVNNFLTYSW